MARLIALLSCLDPSASAADTRGGVLEDLWEQGWAYFRDTIHDMEGLWDLGVRRFALYAPFGARSPAISVGQNTSGTSVTTTLRGPREVEDLEDERLVDGVPDLDMPPFVDFWKGVTEGVKRGGGEIVCVMGPPRLDLVRTSDSLDGWALEPEACGMSLAFLDVASLDRLTHDAPAVTLADRMALRRRTVYLGPHLAPDAAVNGWFDGRYRILSPLATAVSFWAAPANYNVPTRQESVTLIRASDEATAANRVTRALEWMGRKARGSEFSAMVETKDMTEAQIEQLVEAQGD